MPLEELNISHVVVNEHGPMFADFIEFLSESLERLNVRTSRTVSIIHPAQLNLLVGHTMFLPLDVFARIRQQAPSYIVFQVEALHETSGFASQYPGYFEFLGSAEQIWDYSKTNVEWLTKRGFKNVHFVPIGYSSRLERIAALPQQDVDVLFIGIVSERRRLAIEGLRANGINAGPLFGYGSYRDSIIPRSKIQLNIHQFELSHLEQFRISYLLNNKQFVISERSDDNPYDDGVVFCDYNDIVERCTYFLQPGMEEERLRIAAKGYEALKAIDSISSIRRALAALTNSAA